MNALGFVRGTGELTLAIRESIDKVRCRNHTFLKLADYRCEHNTYARQLTDNIVETLDDPKTLYDEDQSELTGTVHLHEASARLKQYIHSTPPSTLFSPQL